MRGHTSGHEGEPRRAKSGTVEKGRGSVKMRVALVAVAMVVAMAVAIAAAMNVRVTVGVRIAAPMRQSNIAPAVVRAGAPPRRQSTTARLT